MNKSNVEKIKKEWAKRIYEGPDNDFHRMTDADKIIIKPLTEIVDIHLKSLVEQGVIDDNMLKTILLRKGLSFNYSRRFIKASWDLSMYTVVGNGSWCSTECGKGKRSLHLDIDGFESFMEYMQKKRRVMHPVFYDSEFDFASKTRMPSGKNFYAPRVRAVYCAEDSFDILIQRIKNSRYSGVLFEPKDILYVNTREITDAKEYMQPISSNS